MPASPQPLGREICPSNSGGGQLGGLACCRGHPRGRQLQPPSRGSWPWPSPVPFAVVQGAAGSEGFVVVFPPPQQGHHGPKGSKQPRKHHHGDGRAPLHLAPCGKRKGGLRAHNKTTGKSCLALWGQSQAPRPLGLGQKKAVVSVLQLEADLSLEESTSHKIRRKLLDFRKQQIVFVSKNPLCALLRQKLYCCSALRRTGDTAAVTNIVFLCFGNVFECSDEAASRRNRAMQ